MDEKETASSTSIATQHGINLRKVVQDKILHKMIKNVTQSTHGWVVFVVDDRTTRILNYAVRMSELTDCGVSIIERLELNRQPFPEMNVVYFITPTLPSIRNAIKDFSDPHKPKYADVYLYFLHPADDKVLQEMQQAPQFLQRVRDLQELNCDFLATEKCAFSCDFPMATRILYSPQTRSESVQLLHQISDKLVCACATLEEYPYVRYHVSQPRMQQLANIFQQKMNDFVARNSSFVYASNRGTLLFLDRGQDLVTPLMHESTFQAMVYDLIDVEEEQISYPAETNSGSVTKTAFLNENDKFWIEFRHTHIAEVSKDIGKRMSVLSQSSAAGSMSKGRSTDIHSMATALRELPEYREILSKLSQHLYLASTSMDIFTANNLLDASNLEQTMATGVDESGKKLKLAMIQKQLEDLFKDPRINETDRMRVLMIFLLTQDVVKDVDKKKIIATAALNNTTFETVLSNLRYLAGSIMYEQNCLSALTPEDIKEASSRATTTEYSNARYSPRLKNWVQKALRNTLDDKEFPYLITPPPGAIGGDDKSKKVPVSLRKKITNKLGGKSSDSNASGNSSGTGGEDGFSGEKLLVFMTGGATFSELRSVYEIRANEKKDVVFGTTNFIKPRQFLDQISQLDKAHVTPITPTTAPASLTSTGSLKNVHTTTTTGTTAEVTPLTSGEIHLEQSQSK